MPRDPAPAVLGGAADRDRADGNGADGDRADGNGPGAERVRLVAAQEWARRRDLERRLHDGAALRISALSLQLGLLRHRRPDGPDLAVAVDDLQEELHLVLQELRDVAGRLYPPLLDEAGLGPALLEAAGRCPVPVRISAPDERYGAAAEGAAYFALLACLPGAADAEPGRNGAGTSPSVDVVVRREGGDLVVAVSGVDACRATAILDDVRLLGGTVAVGPPLPPPADDLSTPAPITVRIPCV